MKGSQKFAALILALVLVSGVFAGCSAGGGAPASSGGGAAPAAGKKTNLVFMHMWGDGAVQNIFNDNKATFEKMYPDYTIELRYAPFDEINKQLSIGVASGELPDITFLNNPDFAAYVEMGSFSDITDMVNEWDEFKEFYAPPLEAGTINGRVYGLPFDTNCLALFYNKDMLDAKGVAVPTTLDELKDAAAKLTDPVKNTYGLIISGKNSEETTFQFMPFLTAFGGKYNDMTSSAAKQALQFYVDLVRDGSMTSEIVSFGQGDIRDRFISKQAAMMINGTWEVGGMRNKTQYPDLDFNWDIALMPAGPNGSYSCLGGKVVGCGSTGNEEAAFNFIKIVCSNTNMMTFIKQVGAVPNRADIASDPIWQEDPQMAVFVKQMETAVPRGPHAKWPDISLAIRTAMGEAITGTKTVDQAFTDAQVEIDKVK